MLQPAGGSLLFPPPGLAFLPRVEYPTHPGLPGSFLVLTRSPVFQELPSPPLVPGKLGQTVTPTGLALARFWPRVMSLWTLALGPDGSGFYPTFPVLAGKQENSMPCNQESGDRVGGTTKSALVLERRTAGPLPGEPWIGVKESPVPSQGGDGPTGERLLSLVPCRKTEARNHCV